jgi:hypothetical protein
MKPNGCLMRTTLESPALARTSSSRLWPFREQTCSARAGILTALSALPDRQGSGRFGTRPSYGCAHRGESGFLGSVAKDPAVSQPRALAVWTRNAVGLGVLPFSS